MDLIRAIKLATKVVSGKSQIDSLNWIRLKGGFLEATDFNTWLRVKVSYTGPEAALHIGAFKSLLKKAKLLTIELAPEEGFLAVSNGIVISNVAAQNLEDYPELPCKKEEFIPIHSPLSSERLKRGIKRLASHVSDDENRQILQYFLLEVFPHLPVGGGAEEFGGARMIATNGHTLSTAIVRKGNLNAGTPRKLLLAALALDLAGEGSSGGDFVVATAEIGEGTWHKISNGDVETYYVTDSSQGYPNWRQVVPQQALVNFCVQASELAAVLEAVPDKKHSVTLVFDTDICSVGWVDDSSHGLVKVRAKLKERAFNERPVGAHPPMATCFNAGYLKTLASRSEGLLRFGLGTIPRLKSLVDFALQPVLCYDAHQQAGEVTLLMPYRPGKSGDESTASPQELSQFLTDQALKTNFIAPVDLLKDKVEKYIQEAGALDDGYLDLVRYFADSQTPNALEQMQRAKESKAGADALWEKVYAIELEVATFLPRPLKMCLKQLREERSRLKAFPKDGLIHERIFNGLKSMQRQLLAQRRLHLGFGEDLAQAA